ncbi:hypothetical protein DL769_007594 [Monosporascus sp. CRB-8-3]|nr:hypothetical protein DL769_007594 [Monosporascus sp. CRB-8-3]
MQLISLLFTSVTFSTVLAAGRPFPKWKPPGKDDDMAGSYVPRLDITEEDTVRALGEGLNFDEELSRLMHQFAVTTDPTPNARLIPLATNLNYTLSELGRQFGLGELAAYLTVFGEYSAAMAPKKHLEYFFQNERLPEVLRWKEPTKPCARSELMHMMQGVINTTKAVSEGSSNSSSALG